jgi:glutamate-5-semialdehyde dehydrogenase
MAMRNPSGTSVDTTPDQGHGVLAGLQPGQLVIFGGNRSATVSPALAEAFRPGDRLIVDPNTGALLHVPEAEHDRAAAVVSAAATAFDELSQCTDDQITEFFVTFAEHLADDEVFAAISTANADDLAAASARGRSTTRLELSAKMRRDMIEGLRGWARTPGARDTIERTIEHEGWTIEARRAPLGVVGFVFEGRPNVFADAAGVVRTGNTVVFRIGSDALGTARAIVEHALHPALRRSGLPQGTVGLIDSAAHAAGWALFSDARLSLAVARGSGVAVAQLGAVARQAGVAVSLHGTGGAWMVAASDADADRFAASVRHSLDRKVCNTLNVCCIVRDRAHDLVPVLLDAVDHAAAVRGHGGRVHATTAAWEFVPEEAVTRTVLVDRADGLHDEPFVTSYDVADLGVEWEWEGSPELTLHVVADVDEAVALCNTHSPHFIGSLISDDPAQHDRFWSRLDAPFVSDGMTRWVDGHYALNTPELGLSNWEGGRMLGRGAILSGDSVYTVRYRARVSDPDLHR